MNWFDDVKKYYAFRSLVKRFVVPVLVLYMVDQGLTVEQIALIGVVVGVLTFVLEVPSGSISDTLGHRRTLIIGSLLQALSMALYLGGTFTWILLGTIVYWGAGTLLTGTMSALFYERLQELGKEDEYVRLGARAKSISQATSIVAMLLAGVAYAVAWWLPFAIGIVQFLLAAVVMLLFTKPQKEEEAGAFERSPTKHLKNAAKVFKQSRVLMVVVLFNAVVLGFIYGSAEFHQVLLSDLGLAATLFGLVYAGKRLMGVVAPLFANTLLKKMSLGVFLIANAVLMAATLAVTMFVDGPEVMAVVLIVAALPGILMNIAVDDFANKIIKSSRATALSVKNLIMQIVSLLFKGMTGLLVSGVGLAMLYSVWGVVLIVIVLLFLTPLLRTRGVKA